MRRLALALVVLLAGVSPAAAQLTGSINGTVTDQSGAAVPGARVTATSPALIAAQVATTSAEGQYRFPSVPPGTYALKIEMTGFATLERKDIIIGLGFNSTVDVKLSVAAQQETITVAGESPVVDTVNSNVQSNFTMQMLKDLPNSRDIWTLIGQSPGMTVSNFDVGGSRAGTQTGYSAYGYSGQVRVQVDGVNTTEGTGSAGFYYDYGSFQEVQLGAIGNDASASTPGLQLNAILKSGGNVFKGDLYYDYENQHFQGNNVTNELRRVGINTGTRILAYRDPNASLGGPILRDRFWFFTSVRDQRTGVTVDNFPVENPSGFEFETRLTNISYKLTYALNQNNRFGHYIQWGRKYQPHRGASSTAYMDSVFNQDSWSWAANFDWNSVVSPHFVFNTRYAQFGYDWPNRPYGPNGELNANLQQRRSENASGNSAGAAALDQNDRKRHQFDWTGTLFRDNFLHGNHAVKFGWLTEWEMQEFTDYGFVDAVSLTFNSGTGRPDFTTPFRVTIRNTPNVTRDETLHHAAFLSDQWKVTNRITATIGLRWEYYTSNYPDQVIMDGPYRAFFYDGAPLPNGVRHPAGPSPYAGMTSVPGKSDIRSHSSVAPRLGVAWNLDGRRTVVKANWGRYYFNTGLASGGINPVQSLTATLNWADPNGDKVFTQDELGTLVSTGGGTTQSIDPGVKHSFTDTWSIWLEREIVRDIGVRIGYTYANDRNNTQNVEQSRLGSLYTSQVLVNDPGPDGLFGNDDDGAPFIVYDIPTAPVPASRTITMTVPGIMAIDRAFDVTLTKRFSGKWSLVTNFLYNWDHDRGNPQNPNQERFNDNTVTLWAFKIAGSYYAPWGVVVSPVLRHQAGDPLARIVQATSGIDQATGLQRNLNLTLNYQADRPGAWREDNITLFDLRLEKRFDLGRSNWVGLFFDVFNITNSNKSQSADNTVGRRTVTLQPEGEVVNYQRFLRPTGVLSPRIFRLGFRYSF
jgi:hypothetical protein